MKVAIVIDIFHDKGNGTSMSARHLVENLIEKGIEVKVLCDNAGQQNETIEGVEFVTFPIQQVPVYQKVIEQQHAWLASPNDARIKEALKDVDLVHIYMPFALGTHCARIAYELKIPVLGCYHVSAENITFNAKMKYIPGATPAMYELLKVYHYKPEWINNIHCPSRCIASTLMGHFYNQNLHIISNGYDPAFKRIDDVKIPDGCEDKIIITSVGRLTEEKRQDLIIKAVARSKYRNKIVLFLAGKGPKQEEYEKLAIESGVDMRIVFLSQHELVNLLNASYLFVQASDVETESIACLEAIACGTVPVISNAKMCATKQFALTPQSTFRKGSAYSLATMMDFWISNKTTHDEMMPKYCDFAQRFSLDKCIKYMLELYDFLLSDDKKKYIVKDYNNPMTFTLDRDALGFISAKHRQFQTLEKQKRLMEKC